MTDKLGDVCGNVLNNFEKENETMERTKIIELVKALDITAEELGIEPRVEKQTVRDEEFVREVRKLIDGEEIDAETARTYFREEYYEDLGIAEKKFKIVRCKMAKTIYKDILIAMPEDVDENYEAESYISNTDNLENDYPDDEEDWELNDIEIEEEDLTESEVNRRGQDEIWNYNDFAE